MNINRKIYMDRLLGFRDKKLIKVITGIRRCGKSTLLLMFQEHLLKENISAQQITHLNFEDPDLERLTNYKELYQYLNKKLIKGKQNYIFLDEIQNVENYEKAVDGLYIKDNVDLYITGSNAYFLSTELATRLSGRYIEISMTPLSFKEYISAFKSTNDLTTLYRNYLEKSSFPYTLQLDNNQQIKTYLEGIYNTVILKDVVKRRNIADVSMLEDIVRFMFDNVGNMTSVKKISDTMTSNGRKISNHTVESYLSALVESFILYKIKRYDIKGKSYLRTNEKYYLADIGLRYFLLGTKKADMGHILENVVYLELLRRGYEVHIGKVGPLEIDFVAIKNGALEYYQVAQSVQQEQTLQRELASLAAIKDHNPKYLLTMDNIPDTSHNGIKQLYVLNWLIDTMRG